MHSSLLLSFFVKTVIRNYNGLTETKPPYNIIYDKLLTDICIIIILLVGEKCMPNKIKWRQYNCLWLDIWHSRVYTKKLDFCVHDVYIIYII